MTDKRPPFPGSAPPPAGGAPRRREPPQMLRRDPNYRPVWPPNPATPPRQPPPPRQSLPPPRRPPPPASPPRRPPPPASPPRRAARPPAGRGLRPPVAPARPRRKPRRARRWLHLTLAILLVLVTATVAAAFWVETSLTRITALVDYPDRPAPGAGTNWLLVGSDGRENLTPEQQADLATGGDLGTSRTDTIMLVHLPGFGSSTPASMVSIPRDSYVPIPGYGSDKINAAYSVGGPQLLAQTVEQATGLRVDHYAEVGFAGFAGLVDAVGGVTLCPTDPLVDPLAGIDLPAGCQRLDGRSALGFVRSRATPRADLDRMTNQRQFMSALVHQAVSPTVLLNPLRWYPMAHAAGATITVDDGDHLWDLLRLAWAMRGDPSSITTVTVPIGEFTANSSGSIVVWDNEAAQRLFAALASDAAIPQDVLDAAER